jgi:hypothetical protein
MKEMKWADIWKKPFWYDHYGYIWSADNVMTFTIDDLTEENDKWMQEFCGNLVEALNGEECNKYEDLHIEDGCDLYQGETLIGYFRGWGHLIGGLKMNDVNASLCQDEMIKYVMDKIAE